MLVNGYIELVYIRFCRVFIEDKKCVSQARERDKTRSNDWKLQADDTKKVLTESECLIQQKSNAMQMKTEQNCVSLTSLDENNLHQGCSQCFES